MASRIRLRVALVRGACIAAATLVLACGGRTEDASAAGGSGGSGGSSGGTSGGNAGDSGVSGTGGSDCRDTTSDPEHCGRCEHSCLGGACQNGVCQPVTLADLGNEGATAIALDAEYVYWARPISRIRKSGGPVTTLADAGPDLVWGIATDSAFVYWGSSTYGPSWRVPNTGGDPERLSESPTYRIAVDDEFAYLVSGRVRQIPLATLGEVQISSNGDVGIAVDQTSVFYTTWSPGSVRRVEKRGGSEIELAQVDYANYVAVHGEYVYFTSRGDNGVRRVSKDGADLDVLATFVGAYGIAADADGIYFADFDGGKVYMGRHDGTELAVLATGQHYPRDIAVDDVAVYWTNDASFSAVMKVAKP
jgi:hypothetical protein